MDRAEFTQVAEEALRELAEQFPEQLDNVAIVVEAWPSEDTLRLAGLRSPYQLLGLYHGVPITQRGNNYNLVTPDLISLYQAPIEASCRGDREETGAAIRRVLRHEVAHHFGISDERLHDIGQY
jgi:predicted Zn-dependent protease with MMP-like domain